MKRILLVVSFACACFAQAEAPAITLSSVTARQRYPWNGKVDISVTVSCADSVRAILAFSATDQKTGLTFPLNALTEVDAGSVSDPNGNTKKSYPTGTYSFVWDSTEYPVTESRTLVYTVSAHSNAQSLPDAVGIPNGIIGDVLIIDCDPNTKVSSIYTNGYKLVSNVDIGTLNCDTYKTTKMAFRKIKGGYYLVGLGTTPTSQVLISKDYYLAIFECTRQQYANVKYGEDPASDLTGTQSEGVMAPIVKVTWSQNHDYDNWATSGFFNVLHDKFKFPNGVITRLPTEVEWEIAARAGTTTQCFYGSTAVNTLAEEYAWFGESSAYMHNVGCKKPNPWGFYDIYGNATELCYDTVDSTKPYPCGTIDPVCTTANGSYTAVYSRGGSNTRTYAQMSSVYRENFAGSADYGNTTRTIRPVIILP